MGCSPFGRRGAALLCVAAAAAAAACAGAPAAVAPAPVEGRVGRVEVRVARDAAMPRSLAPEDRTRLLAVVRQSARDWLEQEGRLAEPAPLALEVELEALELRSAAVTWLFAWAAAPDQLAARVRVLRDGAVVSDGRLRLESALSGYSWRDPGARLDRLARRLGRRIALGL